MDYKINLLFILIIFNLIGCTSINYNAVNSRVPQSVSEISFNQVEGQYFNIQTIEELREIMVSMGYISREDQNSLSFPDGESWNAEVNSLFEMAIDIIDSQIDKGGYPRPKLVFNNTSVPNAFVAPARTCVGSKLIINNATSPFENKFPEIKPSNNRKLSIMTSSSKGCIHSLTKKERALFIKSISGKPFNRGSIKCNFDSILSSEGPIKASCDSQNLYSDDLYMYKTLPFVFINKGLLANLNNWEELLAVIFHELAHYYLPHFNIFESSKYNYFYLQSKQNSPWYPMFDDTLVGTGEILQSLGKFEKISTLEGYYNTKSTFHMLAAMIGNSGIYSANDKYNFDLNQCRGILVSHEEYMSLDSGGNGNFNLYDKTKSFRGKVNNQFAKINSTKLRKPFYKLKLTQSLNNIKKCMQSITLVDDNLPWTSLSRLLDKYSVQIDEKSQNYISFLANGIMDLEPLVYFMKDKTLPSLNNMWEAYNFIDQTLKEGLESLSLDPKVQDIGLYTFEEEADIFTVEMLSLVGLETKEFENALFSMMKIITSHENYKRNLLELSFKDCKSVYENKWILNNKKYKPPLIDFRSNHHNFCHRIYNLTRFGNIGSFNKKGSVVLQMPQVPYSTIRSKNKEKFKWSKIKW